MKSPTSKRSHGARRRGRGLWIALAVLAALGLVGELVLRATHDRDQLDPYTAGLANLRIEPHPYLAYANKAGYAKEPDDENPRQVSHDALGFRAVETGRETTWAKPEGRFRILCVGGSSTYGFGPSSDAATWPARLEWHLRSATGRDVEVINAGSQGYSTHESLINLELRGVEFQPDVVLVYHAINDVRAALYPGAVRDNSHFRAVWPVERPSALQRRLEGSYLFLAWRFYLTDWWEQRSDLMTYVVKDWEVHGQGDPYMTPEPDRGYANFQRNLVSLAAVARRHGARVAFVTQGVYTEGSGLREAHSRQIQLDGLARAREIIEAVGAEDGVPVIDAQTVLEQASAAGEPIFTDEVHLQDRGANLLGQTVAQELLKLGWLK